MSGRKAHWTQLESVASREAMSGLSVVDGIMSYFGAGRGRPAGAERALFIAAVAFSYAVWETYVEDLAVELCTRLSDEIDDSRVPESIRAQLKDATAWELAVHPGWRCLWVEKVRERAKGSATSYGMNTADVAQVTKLFDCLSLRPFEHVTAEHRARLSELVTLRGHVVHTGKVPTTLRKADAADYRAFVEALRERFDAVCRRQCRELLGLNPSEMPALP